MPFTSFWALIGSVFNVQISANNLFKLIKVFYHVHENFFCLHPQPDYNTTYGLLGISFLYHVTNYLNFSDLKKNINILSFSVDQESRHDVTDSPVRLLCKISSEDSTGEEFTIKFIQVNGRINHFMTVRLRELDFCWLLAASLSHPLAV